MEPVRHKRGWLLVAGLALPETWRERLELAPGVFASSQWPEGTPSGLPQHMLEMVSPFSQLRFEKPDLVVWADRPTDTPNVSEWHDPVLDKLDRVFDSLSYVVHWAPFIDGHAAIGLLPAGIHARARLAGIRCRGDRRRTVPDLALWQRLLRRLINPLPRDHVAMRSAIRSFERACREPDDNDRLELFCRAIETLLQTGPGAGAKEFAAGVLKHQHRSGDGRAKRYRRLYGMRNGIIHGYEFLRPRRSGFPATPARLAEEVARQMLIDVLTDDLLYEATLAAQRDTMARRRQRAPRRTRR